MRKLNYIKALFSPFRPFKLKWYAGRTKIGTPYFLPRRWVPNPEKPGYEMAVDKKIGFDVVGLGWKTKWDSYRFESAPLFSFVAFGWQVAVIISAPHQHHYWESWLYYENDTDPNLSRQERVALCRAEAPQTWTRSYSGSERETIDYYDLILKKKYL